MNRTDGIGHRFRGDGKKNGFEKNKKNKEKSESKARWKSSIQSSPLPSDNESMSGSDDEEYRPHARQVEIPSHNTDFAGPLGREMLERYSRKKKAKYNGGFLNRTPTLNELRDTGKWDVYAKTGPDPKDHEWINLEATYSSQGRGRPIRQIQMGHKLSAAEWFQRGSKKHIEKRHTEIFNSGPTKGRNLDQIEEKRKVVANSFSELKTPGKELKNLGERKVINSAFNMRFEHYSFNSKHGGDGFSYINKKTK